MAAEPERRFVTDFFPTHVGDATRLGDDARSATEDALLILNYHLPAMTSHVWKLVHARRCVCADGGANRLYDELPEMLAKASKATDDDDENDAFARAVREAHVPRAIVGDLDSVRPEVLAFYEKRGCLTVDLSHDQDTTDLHKAVTWLERDYKKNERDGAAASGDRRRRVLVTGALGGRFDHEMAHLSCLHAFADTEIVLLGRTSTARLIPKGVTVIVPDAAAEGPTCGLFPMLGPATVSTSGLRWNLDSHVLTFGTNISTSNRIRGVDKEPLDEESLDEKSFKESLDDSLDAANDGKHENGARVLRSVRVETDAPLVWTTDATRARRFVAPFVFVTPAETAEAAETRLEGAVS